MKANECTTSPNKPWDEWEEGLNKDGTSNERMQRENYERFLHYDFPSDAEEEDDHRQANPYILTAIRRWRLWKRNDADMERLVRSNIQIRTRQGMEEGEDYGLSEEEYNCDAKAVGPCRNDFSHVVLDKEDLRLKYNYILSICPGLIFFCILFF